jgi:hypothetical protein
MVSFFQRSTPGDDRPVKPDQHPVNRIPGLRHDPATDEQHHQYWYQSHGKDRRTGHRESLGKGQRREQSPFLTLQAENGQKRDGDDKQREEQGRPYLLARQKHAGGAILIRMSCWQALKVLVGILDHDDGGIDHRADGDGDAAQAHQIGIHAQQTHGDEGKQHADG